MSKRLGRGLDALLSSSSKAPGQTGETPVFEHNELRRLPVEFLQPGMYQPRKVMTDEALQELAESIKAQGVIQPIVVRAIGKDKYEIIAGERRWRASQIAGLDRVPCLVRDVPDEAAIAMALIENIQREDLNAMEEANALHRLMQEFELTHQQVADAVGKSRTTVTNFVRLLSLSEGCKTLLEHGDLDMGHARALLSLEAALQTDVARTVVAKGLTVRETEKLVQKLNNPPVKPKSQQVDPHVTDLENRLADKLGANVAISHGAKGKGKVVISYNSLDELDGILGHMGVVE